MSTINYELHLKKLCNTLGLGEFAGDAKTITGGLLHKMYAVETTKGKYAVKVLNPKIMERPGVIDHVVDSEQVAEIASKNIPSLSAKKFDEITIHKLDSQFYLVFDWVQGKSLKPDETRIEHCQKMGAILAKLHSTDFSEVKLKPNISENSQLTNWSSYLQKGKELNSCWYELLKTNIEKIYAWNEQANAAASSLDSNEVISHRDLDCKNVLWNESEPIIIDWESAGYISSMQDLIETAVYWSTKQEGKIDKGKFLAFINAYKSIYGAIKTDWKSPLQAGFSGKLGWLEYSLKRSLGIEGTDTEEQKLGTEQVIETINDLEKYADMIVELEKWLNDF